MSHETKEVLLLETSQGDVEIELLSDIAPLHVARIKELTKEGAYDGVVFHRVIDGFMAQTGDVAFGNRNLEQYDPARIGTGGSSKPDLPAEFSDIAHERGTVSMARSQSPDSGNSQFFICFEDAPWLNKQYSVWGRVISGMDNVDKIKRGEPVEDPDMIIRARIVSKEK